MNRLTALVFTQYYPLLTLLPAFYPLLCLLKYYCIRVVVVNVSENYSLVN